MHIILLSPYGQNGHVLTTQFFVQNVVKNFSLRLSDNTIANHRDSRESKGGQHKNRSQPHKETKLLLFSHIKSEEKEVIKK